MHPLALELKQNLSDILFNQLKCEIDTHVMVIFDQQSPLNKIVTQGYEDVLLTHSKKTFLDFDAHTPEQLMEKIDDLSSGDAVILVQSASFRVSTYRWRLELFDRKLKCIEHMRLAYMTPEEFPTYIHSLKDDSPFVQPTARKVAEKLENASHIKVQCRGGSIFEIKSKMEKPFVNDGDYSAEENIGGGYPIGEAFSEPVDITQSNGEVEIYAYPGEDHKMRFTNKPFKMKIVNGNMVSHDAPADFIPLIEMMKGENKDGQIPVREFGLGLNRAITKENTLTEASAFERVTGLHLSLGMKHGVYQKKFKKNKEINQRFHVDIYPDVYKIRINDQLIYQDGYYLVK